MSANHTADELRKKARKPEENERGLTERNVPAEPLILALHHQIGNRAVQRLVKGSGNAGELDDETSKAIHGERGHGLSLDTGIQKEMSTAMGHDFSRVQVHTSPQADRLNQGLNSAAFTTGSDIFFKQGQYEPGSTAGKELIAHELTHVVQQTGTAVEPGGTLSVGEPDDAYEKQADQVARAALRQENTAHSQFMENKDEEAQTKITADSIWRQELSEEEDEKVQAKHRGNANPSVASEDEQEPVGGAHEGKSHQQNIEEDDK